MKTTVLRRIVLIVLYALISYSSKGQDFTLAQKGNFIHSASITFSYLFGKQAVNALNLGISYDLRYTRPFSDAARGFAGLQVGYHIPFRHLGDFMYTSRNYNTFGKSQGFFVTPFVGCGFGDYSYRFVTRPQLCNSGFPASSLDLNDYSLTLATNLIWLYRFLPYLSQSEVRDTVRFWSQQRNGSAVVKVRNISLGYANDGPFFDAIGLADQGKDRFWTGSGYLEINFKVDQQPIRRNALGSNIDFMNQFQFKIGFDRFTADNTIAYNIGTFLGLNHIEPKDDYEALLNAGCLYFKLSNLGSGIGLEARTLGTSDLDVQDFIHNISSYSKHIGFGRNRFVAGPVLENFIYHTHNIR